MRLLLLLWMLAFAGLASAEDGPGEKIAAQFARPAAADFAAQSSQAAVAIAAACEAPGEDRLASAREAFHDLVRSWGRLSVLRFGPLGENNRFERLFFWPDPRGLALKQVQSLLGDQAGEALSASALSGKSAALQGLPALEFALFGSGAEEIAKAAGTYRCRYALAVAQNVQSLAEEVAESWSAETGFARSFTAPAPDRAPYRSAAEVDVEIVKALSTTLQFIRAAEIGPGLGADEAKANGRRAPFWRSKMSFELVAAQMKAVLDLLDEGQYAARLPEDQRWILQSLRFEINNALRTVWEIDEAPEQAFADADDRGKLRFADLALEHAGELVSENLSAGLGLSMGFNALDGD
jgi:predicted lipoprotein